MPPVASRPTPAPAPDGGVARPLAMLMRFVLLTYLLSWSIWVGAWLMTGRPSTLKAPGMVIAIHAGSFAPGLAAGVLTAREGGNALRAWARSFVRFGCGWRAYAAALLPLPIAAVLLTWVLGYSPRLNAAHGQPVLFWLTLFPVSIFNGLATAIMGAGPLGEEGGWRGYLLPRLLMRMGEVRASLVLGLIWSLWHLPIMAFFPEWRDEVPFAFFLPIYIIGVSGLACILTVLWRLGRGSLVPCIWFHGLINALGGIAFNAKLWVSGWSLEASSLHSAVAFWSAALALLLMPAWSRSRRSTGDP